MRSLVHGRGTIALDPTLTDRGLTVPVSCAVPLPPHGHDDDDDDDGLSSTCTGVQNRFIPASRFHHDHGHSIGECL